MNRRHPSAYVRRLRRIDAAVAAEYAGIRTASHFGECAGLAGFGVPNADLAQIGVCVNDAPVVELVGTFGVPEAGRADRNRFLHRLLPSPGHESPGEINRLSRHVSSFF